MIVHAWMFALASTCKDVKHAFKQSECCTHPENSISTASLTSTFQCTHEDADIYPDDLNMVDLRNPEHYILYQTNLHLHNIRQANSERLHHPRASSPDYGSPDGTKGRFYPFGCAVGLGMNPKTGLHTNESLVKYDEMFELAAPFSNKPFDYSRYTSIRPTGGMAKYAATHFHPISSIMGNQLYDPGLPFSYDSDEYLVGLLLGPYALRLLFDESTGTVDRLSSCVTEGCNALKELASEPWFQQAYENMFGKDFHIDSLFKLVDFHGPSITTQFASNSVTRTSSINTYEPLKHSYVATLDEFLERKHKLKALADAGHPIASRTWSVYGNAGGATGIESSINLNNNLFPAVADSAQGYAGGGGNGFSEYATAMTCAADIKVDADKDEFPLLPVPKGNVWKISQVANLGVAVTHDRDVDTVLSALIMDRTLKTLVLNQQFWRSGVQEMFDYGQIHSGFDFLTTEFLVVDGGRFRMMAALTIDTVLSNYLFTKRLHNTHRPTEAGVYLHNALTGVPNKVVHEGKTYELKFSDHIHDSSVLRFMEVVKERNWKYAGSGSFGNDPQKSYALLSPETTPPDPDFMSGSCALATAMTTLVRLLVKTDVRWTDMMSSDTEHLFSGILNKVLVPTSLHTHEDVTPTYGNMTLEDALRGHANTFCIARSAIAAHNMNALQPAMEYGEYAAIKSFQLFVNDYNTMVPADVKRTWKIPNFKLLNGKHIDIHLQKLVDSETGTRVCNIHEFFRNPRRVQL